jgi:DNA-directed RNA polymerase subunit RPC12/RpoP
VNFTSTNTEVFLKSSSNNYKSVFYKCNACKKKVDITELQKHAEIHNPVFRFLEWNKILNLYTLNF